MAEDWLLSRIAAVERTALAASRELADVPQALMQARQDRAACVPLPDLARALAEPGAVRRRQVAASYEKYEQAVAALRADVVRALVDEAGAPLSVLARQMGISRQSVSRLYQAGKNLSRPEVR